MVTKERVSGQAKTETKERAKHACESLRDSLKDLAVLCIDDDTRELRELGEVLRFAGATVVMAESAREARAHLGRFVPDVVLCDLEMPVEDGFDFIRFFRGSTILNAKSALAFGTSQHAGPQVLGRAIEAGYHFVIAKPVELKTFVDHVHHFAESLLFMEEHSNLPAN